MTDPHDPRGLEREVACAREGALLCPRAHDLLVVTGRDRASWLNGMVTQDVAKLSPGELGYALHVGKTGKIVADVWIDVGAEELWVAVPRGRGEELAAALDRYLIMERCEIAVGPPRAFLFVWGPRAGEAATIARAEGLRAAVGRRAGLPVALVSAEGDAQLEGAIARILAAVAPSCRASEAGWTRVRVELGVGELGVDFDATAYPQEAALEGDAVSFSKGCYLGQEAVFMMQERGHPPRRLVQLALPPDADVAAGAEILDGGVATGAVTSVARAPERALALGTVRWKHARAGTGLTVAGRAATVTPLLAAKG